MNSATAVVFDHVSKIYSLQRSQSGRSFQETLISLLASQGGPRARFAALDDVSFTLEHGKTYGFIGVNGAGKSTALKLISRIIEPSIGDVIVNGRIGALLELGAGFHPDLSGRENIYLNGAVLGLDRGFVQAHFDEIVEFAELQDFIDVPVKHYSSGMYVRLGFAVAVHTRPDILLVDEVLAVGDASFQQKCLRRISQLRRAGVTIILVTHDVGRVQVMCDEVLWFDRGALVAKGDPVDVSMTYLHRLADQENQRAREISAHRPTGLASKSERCDDGRHFENPRRDRWGSGRVKICSVDLLDGRGELASSFITGEPFEVRIHYVCEESVVDPVFGLAIHHQNGSHVTGPNTRFGGFHMDSVDGEGIICYRVDRLPLLEGAYELSVSAHERDDLEMYDYHDRLYGFRVYPGASIERFGLVTLGGSWSARDSSDTSSGTGKEE